MNCPCCARELRARNRLIRTLSEHQLGLALLVALGKTRLEIAAAEGLTPHNVGQNVFIARTKLGVRNDVELALFLYGLLDQAITTAKKVLA